MPLDVTNWSPDTEVIDETTELLIRAREFIERGWCRGALARDTTGIAVNPISNRAVAWCPNGALVAAGVSRETYLIDAAIRRLTDAMGGYCIADFDDHQKTVGPVLAAFDRAIAAGSSRDLREKVDPGALPPDEGLMQRCRETLMSEGE